MTVKELRKKLKKMNPHAEATVQIWDGDYSLENNIDDVVDYGTFVSIQHSKENR